MKAQRFGCLKKTKNTPRHPKHGLAHHGQGLTSKAELQGRPELGLTPQRRAGSATPYGVRGWAACPMAHGDQMATWPDADSEWGSWARPMAQ